MLIDVRFSMLLLLQTFCLPILSQDTVNHLVLKNLEKFVIKGLDSSYTLEGSKLSDNVIFDGDTFFSGPKNAYLSLTKKRLEVEVNSRTGTLIKNRSDQKVDLTVSAFNSYPLNVWGNFSRCYIRYENGNRFYQEANVSGIFDTLHIDQQGVLTSVNNAKISFFRYSAPFYSRTKLTLANCRLDSVLFWPSTPDTCVFTNLDLSNMKGTLDIGDAFINPRDVTVFLNQVDFSKLTLPLDKVNVVIDYNQPYTWKATIYQLLLKELADKGYSEKYEKYDKEFQEMKYIYNGHPIINFFSKHWWDYGYDKGRVFLISIAFFLFFTLLNYIFYSRLKKVYWPDKFRDHDIIVTNRYTGSGKKVKLKKTLNKGLAVILYTGYLFWGIRLDLKEINIRYKFIIVLVILQHLTGLICLAYIANFIISK